MLARSTIAAALALPIIIGGALFAATRAGPDASAAQLSAAPARADPTPDALDSTVPVDTMLPTPEWPQLSVRARSQLAEVQAAVRSLDTPEKARAAGFRPVLGWIPTMGTHWVSEDRMRAGFQRDAPDHLMFSRVGDAQRLVGIAYAYWDAADAELPDAFEGTLDSWHEHPELAPEGQTLIMLHVWFAPSMDGPFAGHNPWLPYWAAKIDGPDPRWLRTSDDTVVARKAGLAIGEAVAPSGFAVLAERGGTLGEDADRARFTVRRLIPTLRAAREANDRTAWLQTARIAAASWDEIRTAYLTAALPYPEAHEQLSRFLGEMETGAHAVHGTNEHAGHGEHDGHD